MKYSTDLTDKQWNLIEPFFRSNKGKNFVKHSKRDLVNAALYLIKTGCQWRLLSNDFPLIPPFDRSIDAPPSLKNGNRR